MTKEYQKAWREANKEQFAACQKAWRQNNKDKVNSYINKWRTANPEKAKARCLRPHNRFNKSKDAAKRRGLSWEITYEQFCNFLTLPCHYGDTHSKSNQGSGLDRIDNSKGYAIDNVVPCCKRCNRGRQDLFSLEEWQIMSTALNEYNKKLVK